MLKSRFLFVIILNLVIVAAEIIAGLFANSIALVADAFHNLGDVAAITIAFIATLLSERKASRKFTYGYIRAEMMAGFVNSLLLIASMLFIAYESIMKLFRPSDVNGVIMMIAASVALIANAISAYLLKNYKTHRHDEFDGHADTHEENLNLKSAYLHMASDAGISFAVIIGGALITFLNIPMIDPVFTILFSLFILTECVKILKTSFLSLMDASSKNLDEIEKKIISHPEVISVHDVHISKPSSRELFFSVHLVLREDLTLESMEALFEALRGELKAYGVTHPLFQPETEKYHHENRLCQPHCEE